MLTHQSSVDAATCLFAIVLLVQPENWIPGVYILDTIVCHLWNGQFIYWYAVFVSGKFTHVPNMLLSKNPKMKGVASGAQAVLKDAVNNHEMMRDRHFILSKLSEVHPNKGNIMLPI